MPSHLLTWLSDYMHTCLPPCLLARLFASLLVYLHASLSACLPAYNYLSRGLFACLSVQLGPCRFNACVPVCMTDCMAEKGRTGRKVNPEQFRSPICWQAAKLSVDVFKFSCLISSQPSTVFQVFRGTVWLVKMLDAGFATDAGNTIQEMLM